MEKDIEFDVIGIAELIKRDILIVPSNQREYSWLSGNQVKSFLHDINNSKSNNQSHFLGTIVLTRNKERKLEIADGQQRLATTTMFISAVRDYFSEQGDSKMVTSLENDFLSSYDRNNRTDIPRLTLNIDDNDFFLNNVVLKKQSRKGVVKQRRSHSLIEDAYKTIKEYINNINETYGTHAAIQLNELVDYLKDSAKVVKLVVDTEETAYTLFETLNDRGLKTSQADMVKNHIFRLSDKRLAEAQKIWSSMKSAIETVSDIDEDITIEFLRAACCIISGLTTKKEVYSKIQKEANNSTNAIHTLTILENLSREYAAILNQDHQKWNDYPVDMRESIITMNLLGVTQIRPLMLSISMLFNKKDASAAFKKIIAWSVRFMICGIRGGRLDEGYTKLAHGIYKKEIKNVDELKAAAEKIVIGDIEFKNEFAKASVGVSKLARYYLRALENTARGDKNPENIPNHGEAINLEHIMPQKLSDVWKDIDQQTLDAHINRIGNLALIIAQKNSKIGSESFDEKKKVYSISSFLLTNQLSTANKWDIDAIDNRQKVLADIAVKTWIL
ncbi:MAG: DUF262 domain-containing protein [Bacteroidia bacterium]